MAPFLICPEWANVLKEKRKKPSTTLLNQKTTIGLKAFCKKVKSHEDAPSSAPQRFNTERRLSL